MFKSMDFMKDKGVSISRRQCCQGAVDRDAVHSAGLYQVAFAEIPRNAYFGDRRHELIERANGQDPLAQIHQHNVDGDSMEPGCKSRIATKRWELAMQLEKGLLR